MRVPQVGRVQPKGRRGRATRRATRRRHGTVRHGAAVGRHGRSDGRPGVTVRGGRVATRRRRVSIRRSGRPAKGRRRRARTAVCGSVGHEDRHLLRPAPLTRYTERLPVVRPPAPPQDVQQDLAEARADEAIDDEVGAGVDGEEDVADDVDVEKLGLGEGHGRPGGEGAPGAQEEVGRLADDEDDDDHHQGEAVALLTLVVVLAGHLPPPTVRVLDGLDETRVEEGERRERQEEAQDEEEHGLVDQLVPRVGPQRRLVRVRQRHVARQRAQAHGALKEARQVVEDGDAPDAHHHAAHARHGGVLRRV